MTSQKGPLFPRLEPSPEVPERFGVGEVPSRARHLPSVVLKIHAEKLLAICSLTLMQKALRIRVFRLIERCWCPRHASAPRRRRERRHYWRGHRGPKRRSRHVPPPARCAPNCGAWPQTRFVPGGGIPLPSSISHKIGDVGGTAAKRSVDRRHVVRAMLRSRLHGNSRMASARRPRIRRDVSLGGADLLDKLLGPRQQLASIPA